MDMNIFSKLKRMREGGTSSFDKHEHLLVLEAMNRLFHTGAVFEITTYHGYQASDIIRVKRISPTHY